MQIICFLLQLYLLILLGRIVLSWFPGSGEGRMGSVQRFLFGVTEPLLAPFRRVIPSVGGIDLSAIVLIIALQIGLMFLA